MTIIALVTSDEDKISDTDMPFLVSACEAVDLDVRVCSWDDDRVDWTIFQHIIIRSSWNYIDHRERFLTWCRTVSNYSNLINPLRAVEWASNKSYLFDLQRHDVPVIPSIFLSNESSIPHCFSESFEFERGIREIVVKPSVGSRSRNVRRFQADEYEAACQHILRIFKAGLGAIVQPYFPSVDVTGEVDLVYFENCLSHSIRKAALLAADGTVNEPLPEFRSLVVAAEDEQRVAVAALAAAVEQLSLPQPLTYGRVDLVRDEAGTPRVLELDICEPSMSFSLFPEGASRFADTILNIAKKTSISK